VRLIVGEADDELPKLDGPFDLVYLDAWKVDYVSYYQAVLPKLAPRGVIVADNVLWRGHVLEEDPQEPETRGVIAFNEHVQRDERVRAVMLTVGDGMTLIWQAGAAS
jgi:predicted O-methyltransferase YrrM